MENPFKKIGIPKQKVPTELKKEVMADIASLKVLLDLSDLFTLKCGNTVESLLKKKQNPSKNKNEEL